MVLAGASLVPSKENTMGHTNTTERQVQNDSILIAKFCSQLLSHRSSSTSHLFSSKEAILSLLPCFCAPFCAAQFGLRFTLPALPSFLYLSFQPLLLDSHSNKVRVEFPQYITSRSNVQNIMFKMRQK